MKNVVLASNNYQQFVDKVLIRSAILVDYRSWKVKKLAEIADTGRKSTKGERKGST